MLLPVSAPFHCALMAPAAKVMSEALQDVRLHEPVVPLVANATARALTSLDDIRAELVTQIVTTVRWRESVAFMAGQGVTKFLELGPGRVLTGLARRNAPSALAIAATSVEEIAAAAQELRGQQ